MYQLLKEKISEIQIIQDGNLLDKVQMINLLIWWDDEDNKCKLKFTYNHFDRDPIILMDNQIEVDLNFRSGYKIQWFSSNQEKSFAIDCKISNCIISFDGKQLKSIQRLTYKCTSLGYFSDLNLILRLCDV